MQCILYTNLNDNQIRTHEGFPFEQCLTLRWSPSPHVFEHSLHCVQIQSPSFSVTIDETVVTKSDDVSITTVVAKVVVVGVVVVEVVVVVVLEVFVKSVVVEARVASSSLISS